MKNRVVNKTLIALTVLAIALVLLGNMATQIPRRGHGHAVTVGHNYLLWSPVMLKNKMRHQAHPLHFFKVGGMQPSPR